MLSAKELEKEIEKLQNRIIEGARADKTYVGELYIEMNGTALFCSANGKTLVVQGVHLNDNPALQVRVFDTPMKAGKFEKESANTEDDFYFFIENRDSADTLTLKRNDSARLLVFSHADEV
jgi:hypothetical protein